MTSIGSVSLRGITHDDFQYTFKVATGAGEATEDGAGVLAVTMSTTRNTVRLADDGEHILGRLETYENRVVEGIVVGTVALKGGIQFLVDPDATASSPDETPAPGDYLVGSGTPGYVRKASTAEIAEGKRNWQVVEIGTDAAGGDFAIAINV